MKTARDILDALRTWAWPKPMSDNAADILDELASAWRWPAYDRSPEARAKLIRESIEGRAERNSDDSLPFIVDAPEAGSPRAESVVELARKAYTGGDIPAVPKDHDAASFREANSSLSGAILPPPTARELQALDLLGDQWRDLPADMVLADDSILSNCSRDSATSSSPCGLGMKLKISARSTFSRLIWISAIRQTSMARSAKAIATEASSRFKFAMVRLPGFAARIMRRVGGRGK